MGKADRGAVKKKVLFLLEGFDKGGIEKVTLDIVNHLDPEKYDITVQTFWYGGHCQSLVHDNIRVIPFFFKRYVRGIIRLIQYLPPKLLYVLFVHGRYDVEIAASDGGAAKVISGSTNKKAKKVCWVHMDVVARGSKLKEFQNAETARKIYEKFEQISCVSNNCLKRFVKKFGKYPNMSVAHNPLLIEEIKKLADEFNPYIDENEKFRFVSVGRLASEKGYDRLIDITKILFDDGFHDFNVHIIGDGEEKEKLKQMVGQNKLESVVSIEGFKSNPYPYIKNADFFVCSSTDEAFSLVVGESLILQTPVLATKCAGTIEWLGDNQYGILVENSIEGILSGMKHIMENKKDSVLLWKIAAQKKTKHLTTATQMEEWISIMLI